MNFFPDATSTKVVRFTFNLHSHLRTLPRLGRGFAPSHLSTIQHPHESTRKPAPQLRGASRERGEKSKIQNPKFGGSAFSLTEVVIAMGVAAVAFTSIIALFPLGLSMSKESYEATQAALIAQTILADLNDESTGSGTIGSSRFIQIGPNSQPTNPANYLSIDFKTVSMTVYLAYKQELNQTNDTDTTGQPIMMRPTRYSMNPSDFYNSGSNGLSAVVKVTATQCFRINGSGASSNPMRIDVSVETPGNVTNKSRTQFLFTGGTPPG
jgi:type II secretory pathway pseudopilin PulG